MSDLWAITCFFNPAGYKRRIQNYRWFRAHLNAPLVAVELSFDGRFELGPQDADVLVQLDQGDILFQKERLLNVALKHVPETCKAVAWIDCDVIFRSSNWAERTLEALARYPIVQMFRERFDLLPESGIEDIAEWKLPPDRRSLVAAIEEDRMTAADFQVPLPFEKTLAWGLAWAARKDLLDRHGFYDACIFTSGDVAIWAAAMDLMDGEFMRPRMNAQSHRHYQQWSRPFQKEVRGRVGCVDGGLFHLWHGRWLDRRYKSCPAELAQLDFDPFTDLALTPQGTWRWASHKPKLHAHVRNYFWERNEDDGGIPAIYRPAAV